MSHWAEIDENNRVIRVTVGDNNDPAGDEGYSWLVENLGGVWIQTSYNGKIRGKFAAIGDLYDPELDVFYDEFADAEIQMPLMITGGADETASE